MSFISSFLLLFFVTPSYAAEVSSQRCGSGSAAGQSYRWCAHLPAQPRAGTVLFYLHGNGGSEEAWNVPPHVELEKRVLAKGKKFPVVVTISFGATWFLNEGAGARNGSLLEAFVEAAKKTETALSLPDVENRWLMGESMGGFNSLQLYFKRPTEFSRVVSYCPALLNFSPFAGRAEVEAYIARHSPYVIRKLVEKWRDKMKGEYPTASAWGAHSPLALAALKSVNTPLFLGADGKDAFGFQEATISLKDTLRRKKAKVEWHFFGSGAHCDYDEPALDALAGFLSQ